MNLLRVLARSGHVAFAIAETVWKRVLDRTLSWVLVGGVLLLAGVGATADLQATEAQGGLALIGVFVAILLIFIGTTEIPRDLATRHVQVFLSKALGRGEYVLGKFLGLVILAEMILVVYGSGWILCTGTRGLLHETDIVSNLARMSLQLITLCAVVVALSVVLPEVAATIFGVAAAIASYVVFILPGLVRLVVPEWCVPAFGSLYYVLPNSQHYLWNPGSADLARYFAALSLYSFCYSLCALLIAAFWFRRRDLL